MDALNSLINSSSIACLSQKRASNFTMVNNQFLNSTDFTGYEKLVWISIKRYKMTHKTCWPSHKKIASNTGWSVTTVKKAIKGLENKGMLISERKPNHRSNVYTIVEISGRRTETKQ